MVYKEPADLLEEAKDALSATGGRGMVLGTGCVVPITAPHGNIRIVRDAV
jgi:uroporphyrinogen decarboxylase